MRKESPITAGYEVGFHLRAGMYAVEKKKKICSCRKSNLDSSFVQSVA
jgi:hypothetical protein